MYNWTFALTGFAVCFSCASFAFYLIPLYTHRFRPFPLLCSASIQELAMTSDLSSNTDPERWAKIVKGAGSARHPEIVIDDDGKLIAVSEPTVAAARIQRFLADVFKDGDNEWFGAANDSISCSKETNVSDAEPNCKKEMEMSLTQQRANARQEEKDKGLTHERAKTTMDDYTPGEWEAIKGSISTQPPPGIFLEEGKLVATDETISAARVKLDKFLDHVPTHYFLDSVLLRKKEPAQITHNARQS